MLNKVLLGTALVALVAQGGTSSAGSATVGELAREAAVAEIRSHGLDPAVFLEAELTLDMIRADGSVAPVTRSIDAWLDTLGDAAVQPQEDGIGGTPQTLAGDLIHLYSHVEFGGSALRYDVHTSSGPATPPAAPTGLFYLAEGPAKNVKTIAPYDFGVHLTGSTSGSNVDTSPGPDPYPIWLPVVTGGLTLDSEVDFIGHAALTQAEFCYFGVFCWAIGIMVATGVATFDGAAPGFPLLP